MESYRHGENKNAKTLKKEHGTSRSKLKSGSIPRSKRNTSACMGPSSGNQLERYIIDAVPFGDQDAARKYVLFYLVTFFTVNTKGGGRFIEVLLGVFVNCCRNLVTTNLSQKLDNLNQYLDRTVEQAIVDNKIDINTQSL